MDENLPPKLLRVNQPMGIDWTPIPCISVLEAPAGVRVPERGEVIMVMIFAGSNPSIVLSFTRSKHIVRVFFVKIFWMVHNKASFLWRK
jgi:hypothetical protein